MRLVQILSAAAGVALVAVTAQAQARLTGDDVTAAVAAAAATARIDAPSAVVSYANRDIVRFRATVLARPPAERAAAAVEFIDRLLDETPAARVGTLPIGAAVAVTVDQRVAFFVLPQDVNELAGETVPEVATEAAGTLQRALAEVAELRNPGRLFRAVLVSLAVTCVFVAAFWAMGRLRRAGRRRLDLTTERQLTKLARSADVVRAARVPQMVEHAFDLLVLLVVVFLTYSWVTFVFRRFPYTRPWGESLRATLLGTAQTVGVAILQALPNLLAVVAVVVVTRFVVRLVGSFFDAIERGRISVPWLYAETAQPTRRIVTWLLWMLAIIVAYPLVPGSGSDAFKGVSVFAGLMISLGSSGIMNHVMSGLTITYSRAVRVGDFVKIGDVEGSVDHLGVLSMKITTPRREAITIPNALVVASATTNYSRNAEGSGVMVPISVTIGYDTPWRQVEALLVLAANRTAGLRGTPSPVVWRTGLSDFYIQHTLLVCLTDPSRRAATLSALQANILDAFNEYGVQITSPNYESDPARPKVVPRDQWFAAPAVPSGEGV